MGNIRDGHGATIAFDGANSSFVGEIIDIDLPEISVDPIATDHLGSSHDTKVAATLKEVGDLTVQCRVAVGAAPTIGGANENVTITPAVQAGESAAATIAFSGFIKSWKPGKLASGESLQGTLVVAVSGAVNETPATSA